MRPHLSRNDRGSAAIEFAVAVPILIVMIWGMFQVAIVLQANAGVQQALGEGARYATIFDPTTKARPTDDQISTKITDSKFGIRGEWEDAEIDSTNEATDGYIDISVAYDVQTDFLVFPGPEITLSHSKRVYVQSV